MDQTGNHLEQNRLEFQLPPKTYLSEGEKEAASGSGDATMYSTLFMITISLVIIGIQYE